MKRELNLKIIAHMSILSRKIVRALKYLDPQLSSYFKFSAAIDIGMWGETGSYKNPEAYFKNYTNQLDEPKIIWDFHENNFKQFLDFSYLNSIIEKKQMGKMKQMKKFQDLLITIPTIELLSQGEDPVYTIERCISICKKYEFKITKAKLQMMLAGIYLNDIEREHKDLSNIINDALSAFEDGGDKEGIAEANFLYSMIYKNKTKNKAIHREETELQKIVSMEPKRHKSEMPTKPKLAKNISFDFTNEEMRYLKVAQSQYLEIKHSYGTARVTLEIASRYFESGFVTDDDDTITDIKFNLKKAKETFGNFKDYINKFTCNLLLSEFYLKINDTVKAKKYADQAQKICIDKNLKKFSTRYTSLQRKILNVIRTQSRNAFVFLKAFPLIEVPTQNKVGPITAKQSDFKERVLNDMMSKEKVIQVRFDILTKKTLKAVKDSGCRVLHLSSDQFDDSGLCVEGQNGELERIKIAELKPLLTTAGVVDIDVVVLAMPKSAKLARAFTNMGIKHVVFFDFSKAFYDLQKEHDPSWSLTYEIIFDYCVSFYKCLVEEKTINEALKLSKQYLLRDTLTENNLLKEIIASSLNIGDVGVCFPKRQDHNVSCFGIRSWDNIKLETGQLINLSRIRSPTNLVKICNNPFTGRRTELYKLSKYLSDYQIVSIVGVSGIGKSRLAHTAAYFLYTRCRFPKGNYYFDCTDVYSPDECRKLFEEVSCGTKNTLIVLDGIDYVWAKYRKQFIVWLLDVVKHLGATILLTCRDLVQKYLTDSPVKSKEIILCPLNEYESADLLIESTTRKITFDELCLPDGYKMNLHEALGLEDKLGK